MAELSTLLHRSAELHHHLCPRQVLGVRTGMYAARLLGLELPQADKRVFTFVETDGCYADGVAVASGCWLGRRTMRLVDFGKVAATFVDTETGKAIRIRPSLLSRTLAAKYAPGIENRWQVQLEAYQVMPDEELLQARAVRLSLDLDALISKPGARVTCTSCGEEIMNERELYLDGQPVCRCCAGERYYSLAGEELAVAGCVPDEAWSLQART